MALDTLSRLKGIETYGVDDRSIGPFISLDTLSRLKGIETQAVHSSDAVVRIHFGYAFPFEGN